MSPEATANVSMLRRAAPIFLPLAIGAAGVLHLLHRAELSASRTVAAAGERDIVEIARQRAAGALTTVVSDIRYLAERPALRRRLATDDPAARRAVAAEYLAFSTHKAIYDQVRFLDLDGREAVRVDWKAGAPRIVSDDHLRNEADRYCFRETLKLGPRQLYISLFDLNVERGLIEQPIKPVIRFGAPVFDEEGRKRGIVVLNYLGRHLLDRTQALVAANREQIWMLDPQGYWLLGPLRRRRTGLHVSRTRGSDLRTNLSGTVETNRRGPAIRAIHGERRPVHLCHRGRAALSSATAVSEAAIANTAAPQWVLVAHIPASTLATDAAPLRRHFILATATPLSLLAVASWLVARHRVGREAARQLGLYWLLLNEPPPA
jgi:hypothetical protein